MIYLLMIHLFIIYLLNDILTHDTLIHHILTRGKLTHDKLTNVNLFICKYTYTFSRYIYSRSKEFKNLYKILKLISNLLFLIIIFKRRSNFYQNIKKSFCIFFTSKRN